MHISDSLYRVFIKNCVFPHFIATHPLHVGEQLIWSEIWVYTVTLIGWPLSVQPITQPSAGEGEVAEYWIFLDKTQYLINTRYVRSFLSFPRPLIFPPNLYMKIENAFKMVIGEVSWVNVFFRLYFHIFWHVYRLLFAQNFVLENPIIYSIFDIQ